MDNVLSNKFLFIVGDVEQDYSKDIISLNVPGLTKGMTTVPTIKKILETGGNSLDFNDLTMTLNLQENFKVYEYFFNLIKYGNVKGKSIYDIFTNSTITILNKKYKPLINLNLKIIFPYFISDILMNLQTANTLTYDVSFKINDMDVSIYE